MNLARKLLFFTYFLGLFSFGNGDNHESYRKRIQLREEIFSDYSHDSLPTNIDETLNV